MMKYVMLVIFMLYIGCGSTTKDKDISGEQLMQDVTSNENSNPQDNTNKYVKKYESIDSIKELIRDNGEELTYICVGDSTRSTEDSPRLFEVLGGKLREHGINAILSAKSGYKLSEFISKNSDGPNYTKVIDYIPNDGKNTIVDISLAINDLWDYEESERVDKKSIIQDRLKRDLKKAMSLIREKKPKTIFIFTSPNPMREWDEGTSIYMEVYRNLAINLQIPFINYIDSRFKYLSQTEKDRLYREKTGGKKDSVHYSEYGQKEMANYIIKKLGL